MIGRSFRNIIYLSFGVFAAGALAVAGCAQSGPDGTGGGAVGDSTSGSVTVETGIPNATVYIPSTNTGKAMAAKNGILGDFTCAPPTEPTCDMDCANGDGTATLEFEDCPLIGETQQVIACVDIDGDLLTTEDYVCAGISLVCPDNGDPCTGTVLFPGEELIGQVIATICSFLQVCEDGLNANLDPSASPLASPFDLGVEQCENAAGVFDTGDDDDDLAITFDAPNVREDSCAQFANVLNATACDPSTLSPCLLCGIYENDCTAIAPRPEVCSNLGFGDDDDDDFANSACAGLIPGPAPAPTPTPTPTP